MNIETPFRLLDTLNLGSLLVLAWASGWAAEQTEKVQKTWITYYVALALMVIYFVWRFVQLPNDVFHVFIGLIRAGAGLIIVQAVLAFPAAILIEFTLRKQAKETYLQASQRAWWAESQLQRRLDKDAEEAEKHKPLSRSEQFRASAREVRRAYGDELQLAEEMLSGEELEIFRKQAKQRLLGRLAEISEDY